MKKEEIDILLGKFYDGLSTTEEERTLINFFTANDVPSGYETEKALFGYYSAATESPETAAGFEEKIISALDAIPSKKRIHYRRLSMTLSGIAAGMIILIVSWFLLSRNTAQDTFRDPEIAYAETLKILYEVSAKMNSGAASLAPVSKMNITDVEGFRALSRSKEALEKNLENLEYFQKVIGITNFTEEEKK